MQIQVRTYDPDTGKTTGKVVPVLSGPALEEYLRSKYKSADSRAVRAYLKDQNIHLSSVYTAFGFPPEKLAKTDVRAVLSNDNLKPFFGPTTEDGFRLGIQSVADKWEPIIGTTVDVDTLVTEWYEMQDTRTGDDYTLRAIGQGAEIPVAQVRVAGRNIALTKKGRGIQWTDEALSMPVSLVQMFLQVLGIRIGQSYYRMLADRLINGYLGVGIDDPTVITSAVTGTTAVNSGVRQWTATGFKADLSDLLTGKDVLEEYFGYPVTDVMMHPNTLIRYSTLTWGNGAPVFPNADLAAYLGVTMHRNTACPVDIIVYFNRQASLIRYVYKQFGTEDERTVSRQITATYATLIDQVVPGMKDARLVMDLEWTTATPPPGY